MTGAVVAQEIMRRFGQEVLLVSEWGLREGIVFELYGKIAKRSAAEKPVRRERGSGV